MSRSGLIRGSPDVRGLARAHFGDDAGFDERLTCYETHIGLDAQRYQALMGRRTDLEASAARTLEVSLRSSGRLSRSSR
jgi:hypothetical protein